MRKTSLLLAALLAVAGIYVMLWPVFTGQRLQADTDEAVQSFLEERKPEQQYPELLAALQEYNRQLYAEKQCNLTDLEACEEPAADLIAYGIEDEIIGVLEIPAMELTMPVYLGASDAFSGAFPGMNIDAFLKMESEGTLIFRPYSKYTTRWSDQYQKSLVTAWNDPSQMNAILDKLAADMNALLKQE